MANIKNFSGAIELVNTSAISNEKFAALFPGVKGLRYDGYSKRIGWQAGPGMGGDDKCLPVTRSITYKSNPSKHVCNSKCLGGKITGTCECQCGGKNHGAGMFTSLVAA